MVTQALCDVCAVAADEVRSAACSLPGQPRVINLEPNCLEDVFDCLAQVGEATGRQIRAAAEIKGLRDRVVTVESRSQQIKDRPRVVVLEWIDPPFSSGHWSPELVRIAGGEEVVGGAGERSRSIDWQQIVHAAPEVLVIACCGFDVERTLVDLAILRSYPGWNELSCVASQRVYVVDGSAYFSRPGPRLVDSLEILAHALHPNVHPLPAGLRAAIRV